ncbi:MAG: TIGR03862 family flavoprotein [Alphaproteobacteria bacterium]|nr:TIGR03862 family flavoprotein [Alphaproteobacteria bacterium]
MEVTVVGAGPAGLMAAEILAKGGVKVTILDHMAKPARKFLLAGRGGLNLTHSEPLEQLLARYGEAKDFMTPAINAFPPAALMAWANGLGVETFIGSSGRIFPKQMKASPLLRAWLRRLESLGVELKSQTRWQGFDGKPTILAMGGASWPQMGSDAQWVPILRAANIRVNGFKPANSRFLVNWTKLFRDKFAGTPIKNVALNYAGQKVRGELMISSEGIEGGAIYALSRVMRDQPGEELQVDLRPDLSLETLQQRLSRPRGKESQSNFLRKAAGLNPVSIALLYEAKLPFTAENIKTCPIKVLRPASLARAISSAGGVALAELDQNFKIKAVPNTWAIGEMVDWEAPTGGYLLQACFSSAVAAATDCLKIATA